MFLGDTVFEVRKMAKSKKQQKKTEEQPKTATDNQWFSTGKQSPSARDGRRDGPGGENAKS